LLSAFGEAQKWANKKKSRKEKKKKTLIIYSSPFPDIQCYNNHHFRFYMQRKSSAERFFVALRAVAIMLVSEEKREALSAIVSVCGWRKGLRPWKRQKKNSSQT
jgi:hypothetical protein